MTGKAGRPESRLKKIIRLPLYPAFMALYPVLALLSYNIGQVRFDSGLRPMLLSLLLAGLVMLFLKFAYRDAHRAALATCGLWLLFFIYGPLYDLIAAHIAGINLAAWMLTGWALLAAILFFAAALPRVRYEAAASTLNLILLGLLIYPGILILQGEFEKDSKAARQPFFKSQDLQVQAGDAPPDIYYLMPEDYGRVDLLQSKFHIDVTQFVQDLQAMGFYVAGCSQSNYATSELSLGSSLNMEYLQNLDNSFDPATTNQRPVWDSIRYSAVALDLKKAGYKTVAFATGFAWSELDNSDVFLSPSPLTSGMTSFESVLLRTTPVRHLQDVGIFNLDEIDGEQYRERTLLEFNSIQSLARMPGPKFVFVHIINPHEPFVFGPDGAPIDPAPFINESRLYTLDAYTRGFQQQIPFLNTMLERAAATLIKNSATPPVIILQTDTAPLFTTGSDAFKILNAYYMPGHTDLLYTSISPVNTFRVIFNEYLGTQYPLLKDVSYKSPIPHIYKFSEVPNAPCANP